MRGLIGQEGPRSWPNGEGELGRRLGGEGRGGGCGGAVWAIDMGEITHVEVCVDIFDGDARGRGKVGFVADGWMGWMRWANGRGARARGECF